MKNFTINTNGKHNYIMNGIYTVLELHQIIDDTKAISTQRARAKLALEMCEMNNIDIFDFGTAECTTVGGTENGERGGNFEIAVSVYLKNLKRISPKGKSDIVKYIATNSHKKRITLDCKQGACDLGYYNIDIDDYKLVSDEYIIYCPLFSDTLPIDKCCIVIPTKVFIIQFSSFGLIRKKKTNNKGLKLSLQNINSFKSVDKVINLFSLYPTLHDFCIENGLKTK